MFFDHKKKLILSTVLLILMFDLDVVKGCSGGDSTDATTKAPYKTTTTTTSTNDSTGMYICRKSSSLPKATEIILSIYTFV